MKIIVAGGAGTLGQYAIREFLHHGHEVLCVDTARAKENICLSLIVDLRETKELSAAFQDADAVVHLARKRFPYTANGFDPASRVWKTPEIAEDAERFSHNVTITYNVLVAALQAGVKRVLSGSSLAVYGLYYPLRPLMPDYLPIDEDHPLRPQDPYGMSKLVGEELCDAFARKSSMQIASLRFAGIATGADYPKLVERQKDPLCRGTGALWTYVDVRDAATACRLALKKHFQGHQAFNICAPTTIMNVPTQDLVREYLPQVKRMRSGLEGNWSGYDTSKAEAVLGFRAEHLLEN
jgi:nucleoside-diphosphate-sugar epimerase